MNFIKIAVAVLAAGFVFATIGCGSKELGPPVRQPFFTCTDYRPSMPLEIVDAETNGQKSGSSHFKASTADVDISFDFETLPDQATATERAEAAPPRFSNVLRKAELKDVAGNVVGKKFAFIKFNGEYNLVWNRGPRLYRVVSDNVIAIREFEKACGF